jgi:hypothetical protein
LKEVNGSISRHEHAQRCQPRPVARAGRRPVARAAHRPGARARPGSVRAARGTGARGAHAMRAPDGQQGAPLKLFNFFSNQTTFLQLQMILIIHLWTLEEVPTISFQFTPQNNFFEFLFFFHSKNKKKYKNCFKNFSDYKYPIYIVLLTILQKISS